MQTDAQTSDEHRHEPLGQKAIHIFVRRGQQELKLTFEDDEATGLAIKTKAGGGVQDGLYFSKDGKNLEVADDEVVALHDGMHFTLIPNGKVS